MARGPPTTIRRQYSKKKKGIAMPYMNNPMMSTNPQPSNNLWVGNNYSGYSPNRSTINQMPAYVTTPSNPYQPEPIPQTIDNVLSVMGPESAESFKIGPNSKVVLLDSNRPVIYIKHSDDSGYSQTHAFKLTAIPLNAVTTMDDNTPQLPESSEYVTKQDFEDLKQAVMSAMTTNAAAPSLVINKDDFDEFKKMIEDLVMKDV